MKKISETIYPTILLGLREQEGTRHKELKKFWTRPDSWKAVKILQYPLVLIIYFGL